MLSNTLLDKLTAVVLNNSEVMDDSMIKELSQLSKSEKLLLVEALWDSIASDPEQIEVPEHHKTVLEERLKTIDVDKAEGSSWESIREKYL